MIVSARALIVLNPMLGSVAHEGINPHLIIASSRKFGVWRMTGTG